jgi:hypothetical protein
MRLVEFTTECGTGFAANPARLQVWRGTKKNGYARIYISSEEAGIVVNCTYQEVVDRINAALEPERVPTAKTWKVKTICDAIRTMRSISGFMPDELESRLDCSAGYIQYLESGENHPPFRIVDDICRITNCSLTVTGDGFEVRERGDNE